MIATTAVPRIASGTQGAGGAVALHGVVRPASFP